MHFSLSRFFPLLTAVVVLVLLAGCGKKGNLYLPTPPAAPVQSQPVQK